MSLSNLLARAHPLIEARLKESETTACVLFFSLSDGSTRARVYRGMGRSFRHAWQEGVARCQREAQRNNLTVRWLRIDRVIDTQATTWGALAKRLSLTKRNYFRLGLALNADYQHAFLEQELNANAMLYLGADKTEAGLNPKNFTAHAKRRFGENVELDFSPERPVYLFSHEGLFLADDPAVSALPESSAPAWLPGPADTGIRWRASSSLNAGRRQIDHLNQDQVYALIDSSASFLARQVKKSGQFVYGHFPCFGRAIPTYNALRHASSVYSMLEGWELTRNETLLAAIRRALGYLTETLIRRYPQTDGPTLAFNVDVGDEIKLGANAVSLLALVKYDELTGDTRYRPLMEELALGIARMQNADDGSFVHVLNAEDLSLKEAFRIVYYDGEAAFGLMRLYGLTSDPRWLAIVEKAFDHFIRAEHWKHHDHWLSYCANELTLHKPEEKYFRFGVQNVANFLDFILKRETTYPTLLELSMAFEAMLRRIENDHPEMRHVLDGLDIDKFHRALHHRAHYLLNGFFWPELAMYYAKPSSIVGSFFIRHHSFRVRIDDIEHYLSGYVAYWKLLGRSIDHLGQALKFSPPAYGPVVAWGGDVNLGRRQHFRTAELGVENVLSLPALAEADLSIVNLECVVATQGEQGVDKGEGGPYYYRARPEMLRVLVSAGVDIVTTANNHSGDYGPQALLEQNQWLDAVGIGYAGSGANFEAALAPVFRRAGNLNVAVFSIDASMSRFSATSVAPGSAHLPLADPRAWRAALGPRIAAARMQAHVVLVAVHWGVTMTSTPSAREVDVAHALIESGADAVLGASAHQLQGVEIYQGRPILHDAGDLLFDAIRHSLGDSGIFHLELSESGVQRVRFIPVGLGFGFSEQRSGDEARAASQRFAEQCAALGTVLNISDDGSAFVDLAPGVRHQPVCEPSSQTRYCLEALDQITQTSPHWQVKEVLEDARMAPVSLEPLTLLGIRVKPTEIMRRQMLWVESFWRCDAPIDEDIRIDIRALPIAPTRMRPWGVGMDHDPCDWMVPTSRWQPGVIYRDLYGLRPPYLKDWENVDLQLTANIVSRKYSAEPHALPIFIKLSVPGKNPTSPLIVAEESLPGRPPPSCYFCIYHLSEQLAGIEHAVLARTLLFAKHVGMVPHILSNHLDPWIMERWFHHRDAARVGAGVEFINLYEDILEISTGNALKATALTLDEGLSVEDIPTHTRHQRIRDKSGKMRLYVVWRDHKGGRLDYINYFSNGQKLRRDRFNRFGQLQISQALNETGQVLWETCFTPNGQRRLVRRFDPAHGNLSRIEYFHANGLLDAIFDNEQALTVWWLQRSITSSGNLFMIDRGPQWSRALREFSECLPQRLFPIMHSTHVLPGEDPMTGALNSRDRRETLSNRASGELCIVLTERQRVDIAARFPTGCRLAVIPHPVHNDIIEADFDTRDPDLLVAFVRLVEDKRVEDMIEIMARVVRVFPEKKLQIYGEGPCRNSLESLIEARDLRQSVYLMGYVENVGEILDRASFSLLTSKREGFSLILLESLTHGCPPFAYDIRYGPDSMIEHGKNGLLIPDGDVKGGAQALITALSDSELLRSMSRQAYAKARQFDSQLVAQKWRKALNLPVSTSRQ